MPRKRNVNSPPPSAPARLSARRRGIAPGAFAGLWLGLALAAGAAPAQTPDLQGAKQRELESLRQSIEQSARRRRALESERRALEKEAEGVSGRLIATAARIQALESRLDENEKRISRLAGEKASLLTLLRMNRAAIAELLAGLQKLRRDPPPPFVTAPHDVLAALRGSMLLSAAIPSVDARAARLMSDLRRLEAVRGKLLVERKEKRRNIARLREARAGLEELLVRKRRLLKAAGLRLRIESDRLSALMNKARDLDELISALRREEKRRQEAARLRALEEKRRREEREKAAREKGRKPPPAPPPRRVEKPRVAFTRLKGRLPWPAQGRLLIGFGEKIGLDSRAQGLYVSTRPGASVIAPADARVEVARPFRSYGELLILDAGQGYRILLAGLRKTMVRAGDFVRAGEPVGEMGETPAPATVTSSRMDKTRPILYMELRKNGRPVNATPWWLAARREASRK